MARFIGCMLLGTLAYLGMFLYALFVDWEKFEVFHPHDDWRELWEISTGKK